MKKVNYFEGSDYLEREFGIEFSKILKRGDDKGINDSLLRDDIDLLLKHLHQKF